MNSKTAKAHEPSGLMVLADRAGKILASAQSLGTTDLQKGGPTGIGIIATKGQVLHNIPVPEGYDRKAAMESLSGAHVIIEGGRPVLARRSGGAKK